MPLPNAPKMAWPPHSTVAIQDDMDAWAAWYSGKHDDLARVYGDFTGTVTKNRLGQQFFDVRQRTIRGMLARWFWGHPVPAGEQRSKIHLPVAGDIAAISADLLYAEPPIVTVPDGNDATQAQVESYIEDGLWTSLRESAEVCAAMGGAFLRVVWDDQIRPRPWLQYVSPEVAVPEWRWDQLSAVTFWRLLDSDSGEVVRHLERHEPGVILHGVYAGTRDELGRRMSLADFPETADLAAGLSDEDAVETGVTRLTAGYVPNMRPNRVWHGVPSAANLGRSDFSGVEGLMDAIDEVFSSWLRDVRLAKARIIVPQSALINLGKGKGATFDVDQELFVPLDMGPNPDAAKLTLNQFEIRHEAHQATLQFALETCVRDAGYSMQTLSGSGDVAMTATEVNARERRSMLTRGRKIQYNGPVLRDMLEVLLAVDQVKFGPDGVQPATPHLEWPKNVFVDPMDMASTLQLMRDAMVVSQDTAVRMLHPDWSDGQVADELRKIHDDEGASTGSGLPVQLAGPPDPSGDPTAVDPTGPIEPAVPA